jgi:hypothetical protein
VAEESKTTRSLQEVYAAIRALEAKEEDVVNLRRYLGTWLKKVKPRKVYKKSTPL